LGAVEKHRPGARLAPEHGPDGIELRALCGLAEFEQAVELEKTVWATEDIDTVPTSLFVVVEKSGGQALGAFDTSTGGRMIGFVLALAGIRNGRPYLHSHMTAVIAEWQNRGIGRRLKLYQRREALGRRLRLIEWTFDPLELRNAHFNIVRLGAIMRHYAPNCYGVTSSPLHAGLPTDRLVAEWWLASRRVRARCDAPAEKPPAGPRAKKSGARPEIERIFVPGNIAELKRSDPRRVAEIQARVRAEFLERFAAGWTVTGLESTGEGAQYLLEPYADSLTQAA
jgi:predicted GNAT superfamily acetyltransferase